MFLRLWLFILPWLVCVSALGGEKPVCEWSFDPAPEGVKVV